MSVTCVLLEATAVSVTEFVVGWSFFFNKWPCMMTTTAVKLHFMHYCISFSSSLIIMRCVHILGVND